MIEVVETDGLNHRWRVTCDYCFYRLEYGTSAEISGWTYRKSFLTYGECHVCPTCSKNFSTV